MFVRVSSRSSKLTERGNMLLRERERERKFGGLVHALNRTNEPVNQPDTDDHDDDNIYGWPAVRKRWQT